MGKGDAPAPDRPPAEAAYELTPLTLRALAVESAVGFGDPMLPEDEAGTSGPYLWVALPVFPRHDYLAVLPMNLTSLLLEWEAMLDPKQALRSEAGVLEEELEWRVTDRFIVPTFATPPLLHGAVDDALMEAFHTSRGTLVFPETWRRGAIQLPGLVTAEHTLANRALPVLLGLVVVAAMSAELGYASRQMWSRWEAETLGPEIVTEDSDQTA